MRGCSRRGRAGSAAAQWKGSRAVTTGHSGHGPQGGPVQIRQPGGIDEPTVRVELPGFEGPLDLLLHLIKEHELDILDIPIGFITEKYLEYLTLMQELNIDVASEYLVMAATLAHIKSRLLLPSAPADEEDEGDAEADPRAELIRRLLEYQKYKLAAEELSNKRVLGRDVFPRGSTQEGPNGLAPLAPVSSFKLLEAFKRILERSRTKIDHEIEFERISISDRINQLIDRLTATGAIEFEALFDGAKTRADLVVTFLALLELTRLRITKIFQDSPLGAIVIELAASEPGTGATAVLTSSVIGDIDPTAPDVAESDPSGESTQETRLPVSSDEPERSEGESGASD